jgi:cytochrome c oxidase subunit 2
MYKNLTNYTDKVDDAFLFILSVITFFLIAITVTIIVFLVKYRAREGRVAKQIEGNDKLEVIWTVIPLVLVLVMFWFGWRGWKPLFSKAPDDAMVINTTSRMWQFGFEYENGKKADTLYIPVGKAIKLDLEALDIIHSIYIPAFRLKQDMVPGDNKSVWFIANEPGRHDLFCTEYCGLRHSYMYSAVVVMPEDEFSEWYIDTTKKAVTAAPGVHPGLAIMQANACNTCHSLDGSKLVGPSYRGLFGKEEVVVTDGKKHTIVVDEEYLKKSIWEPNADIVDGYNKGLMQSYKDQITAAEVDSIIVFLKSLQ